MITVLSTGYLFLIYSVMVMGMRMRMCGHFEKARVIQPDGQVRQVELPVSVGDLLRFHPHHYVRDACTNRRIKSRASIMPMEAQLERGGIYLLLPLPRLFPPSSGSARRNPPPCACFLRDEQDQEEEEEVRRAKCGPSISMGKRRQCGLLFFTSCIAQSCKVSPDGLRLGLAGSIHGGVMKGNRIWEPSLEIILENDILPPLRELVEERKRIEHKCPNQVPRAASPSQVLLPLPVAEGR